MKTRLNIKDCLNIAKLRGGMCLSTEYKNTTAKMKWECKECHVWETTFKIIKKGSWCLICSRKKAGEKRKGTKNKTITIDYCKEIAKKKRGTCLSTKYKSKAKLIWKCEKNHIWETTIDRIQSGRWCHECHLLKVKPTIEKFKIYAKSMGGECLSNKYINSKINLEWKCKRNHVWESRPRTSYWCRECSIMDSYIIGIDDLLKFAESKDGECLSKEYKSGIPIKWKCKRNHIWKSIYVGDNRTGWCIKCTNIEQRKYDIKDCIKSANSKGGECLSDSYINSDISMDWKCEKGHVFRTRYSHIVDGSWCKKCCTFERRLGLQSCMSWAKKKGGRCISTEYANKETIMVWECNKKHKWNARFGSLIYMKSWCPRCSNKGYSKAQIQWLKYLSIKKNIRHAETDEGEYKIPKTRYSADGYEKTTNTIYEYHGSYWHGDIREFNPTDINKHCNRTFGQLLKKTIKKEMDIRNLDYNYVCIWGYDWRRGIKAVVKLQRLFRKW